MKSKKTAVIILAALIILVLVLGFWLLHKDNETSPQQNTPPVSEITTEEIEMMNERIGADIILAYSRTSLFGLYVDYTPGRYAYVENPDYAGYDVYEAGFFNSVDEGIEFTKQYLSEDIIEPLYEMNKNSFFTENGKLLYAVSGRGVSVYDKDSIRTEQIVDNAKIWVDRYDSMNEYEGTYVIKASYVDGHWIMTSLPEFESFKSPMPQSPSNTIW